MKTRARTGKPHLYKVSERHWCCEIPGHICVPGVGNTPEEAFADYVAEIEAAFQWFAARSGQRLTMQ